MKEVYVTDERYTKCDKCGKKIEKDCYDSFECKFNKKIGASFPDGGSGEEETLDICQECSEILVKLLLDNGYNIQFKEWDF